MVVDVVVLVDIVLVVALVVGSKIVLVVHASLPAAAAAVAYIHHIPWQVPVDIVRPFLFNC
jgi:hypothetical protein